jgi:hypothetical protein
MSLVCTRVGMPDRLVKVGQPFDKVTVIIVQRIVVE